MNILILGVLDKDILDHFLCANVLYRPDLQRKNPRQLKRAILEGRVDAVIATDPVCQNLLAECSEAKGSPLYYVHACVHAATVPAATRSPIDIPVVPPHKYLISSRIEAESQEKTFLMAFKYLEQQSTLAHSKKIARPLAASTQQKKVLRKEVLLVGAGLVNLITAHRLIAAGYTVRLVDGGPDPRVAAHWKAYGCSRGGDDARMFTLSEMDNYNDRSLSASMNSVFNRSVVDLGWNVHWRGTLSEKEEAWSREFESIPTWLANHYNDDIFAFNRESKNLWDKWLVDDRPLFEDCVLREGILRIYSDEQQYRSAIERQNRIGATEAILSPLDVSSQHPALAPAVSAGRIAGGIHVVGFTINAHKFIDRLLGALEDAGADFIWNEKVHHLVRDTTRQVIGIRTTDNLLAADHYVLSPGAYSGTLLEGTRSDGKIHGVLGAWFRIPNRAPALHHSLKLARKAHITEDANITVATDVDGEQILIIGSGYGYTGSDPRNIDPAQLQAIYQGLIDTAEKFFPENYAEAVSRGNVEESLKFCVRPWTTTGLGVFEKIGAEGDGVCVITGGHNTGGFAQAPAIAEAVLKAIQGLDHPMHRLYDPDRINSFLSARPADEEAFYRPQNLIVPA